jgi:ribosomal protein S18 acetylase RimI-like enzyme
MKRMRGLKVDTMITLVDVTPEDEPFWLELYADTRREEINAFGWPERQIQSFVEMQYTLQKHSYTQQYPQAQRLTIYRDGSRIGRLIYAELELSIALIDISILTPYRAQGIGTSLLTSLQQHAQLQRKSLQLHVYAHNPAHNLYLKLGFKITHQAYPYIGMQWHPSTGDDAHVK